MSADVCACGSRFHTSCSALPAPIDDRSPTERAAAAKALDAALAGERAASARALNAEAWAVAALKRCDWLEEARTVDAQAMYAMLVEVLLEGNDGGHLGDCMDILWRQMDAEGRRVSNENAQQRTEEVGAP
jgi:hypothetical protein